MNSFERQDDTSLKSMMRWQSQAPRQPISPSFLSKLMIGSASPPSSPANPNPGPFPRNPSLKLYPPGGSAGLHEDEDLIPALAPPAVTVVLEGRSICHRISLHEHESYHSLARALRQMFVDEGSDGNIDAGKEKDLDLSNAIPGYLIAYEDMENDLLLAGDLNWKDFVRVAKRIRILPARSSSRKGCSGIQATAN